MCRGARRVRSQEQVDIERQSRNSHNECVYATGRTTHFIESAMWLAVLPRADAAYDYSHPGMTAVRLRVILRIVIIE